MSGHPTGDAFVNTLQQGVEILRKAEQALRSLLSQAAERAEYDNLLVLTDWARILQGLAQEPPITAPSNGNGAARDDQRVKKLVRLAQPKMTPAAGPKKAKSRREKNNYPKFLRDGEHLVKIGWSKREKKPYEHKSPKRVLTLLTDALVASGRNGRRFAMEDVLPLRDPEGGGDIPSYQVYLTLAWLRAEDLITQHGRQGYSLRPDINLHTASEEHWKRLPGR